MPQSREAVIIFQIGSLGDTVISLPCYRHVIRSHADANIYLLTNYPTGKMVSPETVLPTGLISGCVEYPMPLRGRGPISKLYGDLRRLHATTLYYLAAETKLLGLMRHYAFFRICGINRIIGMPWSRDLRSPREVLPGERWESEASRLLRCIGAHSRPGAPSDGDRSLDLSEQEHVKAKKVLGPITTRPFIAVSTGGKIPINDWGDANWRELLNRVHLTHPDIALVLVGSADERNRNDRLAAAWGGTALNACGLLSPRETAALRSRAILYIGHDTGTLHLAAAVGTRLVGIYSARNPPGKWFSDRDADTHLYTLVDCLGCECVQARECPHDRRCITSIDVHTVHASAHKHILQQLQEHTSTPGPYGTQRARETSLVTLRERQRD